MGTTKNIKKIGGVLIVIAIVILLIVVILKLITGTTTGDMVFKGNEVVAGLKCTDTTLDHPVFVDVQPVSHANTITASFRGNTLSMIMYRYDGTYQSEDEAVYAKVKAEADYNLILADDYGVKIDIFTHTFMRDGNIVALTISGKADKATSKTAPYFLLESTKSFPKTLDGLQTAYEAKGFSCIVENEN